MARPMSVFFAFILASSGVVCWQPPSGDSLELNRSLPPPTMSIVGDRDSLHLQSQAYANASVPGKSRGSKRRSLPGRLEARQDDGICTDPGYILVCPITENNPCCDPEYPICCHDPSDTCCPSGTFCQGLQTCCVEGATGCGEGCCIAGVPCCNDRCCPSSAYTCDNSSEIPQCRLIASSSSTQSESTTSSATATPSQSDPPAQSSNNAAIIGGAVGGAVALILIGLLAWWIVKKNKKPMPAASTSSRPANDTPSNAGNQPLMASTPSAYHGSNGTPITPFTQPGIPTTSGSPPITAQPSTYPAHSVMTFTTPTGGVGSSGHVSGFGYAAGAGMSGGAVPAESNDQQSYGQGGLGYVPPPPEGSTSGPVYSASMQVSQDFPGHATTSNYSPSTLPSSFSPFVPMSAMAHQGDSRPPWAQGSGIASPEPSYTGTLSPSLIHPYTDAASYSANPGSGTTCDLVDQATNNPNQGSFVPGAMSPPPGVVSPPPPFTPSPGRRMDGPSAAGDGQAPWAIPVTTQTSLGPPPNAGYGGPAGNDGQGRVVPMTAPGDRKAAFRNASRGGS